ncbi:hypothetical protein DY000_02007016 [Brassica cretica]|uniref:Uncharacterized protein n=1 Tax=Brassica cretica TaxID=69181 RepID=A0ABQ7CB39_BRACR|nr:hypothetical protein DY000_02007016 [Brassica cretica]
MVSSEALQSCICSQDLVLAGPSSSASHRQNHRELYQISASGLADKQVGARVLQGDLLRGYIGRIWSKGRLANAGWRHLARQETSEPGRSSG